MTKVSVIVPLYNQEDKVAHCISSLQAQTMPDFEAIFIDDASSDSSAEKVDLVSMQDKRFVLIRQSSNKGAGAARNLGIKQAKGESICFADPDDVLPENSLELRYTAYKKHNAIVRSCHLEISSSGKILNYERRPTFLPELFNPSDFIEKSGVNPFVCAHWTWLFPSGLLQRLPICYEEGLKTAEDIAFLVRIFKYCSRMVWIDEISYYWVKQENSLSNRVYTAKHYKDYFFCTDLFYENLASTKLKIGDIFFNEYLLAYLSHLCNQFFLGKSSQGEVAEVLSYVRAIAKKHGSFERLQRKKGKLPLLSGIEWLYLIEKSEEAIEKSGQAAIKALSIGYKVLQKKNIEKATEIYK